MCVHIKHQLHLLFTLLQAVRGMQAQQQLAVMLAVVQVHASARGLLPRRQLQELLRQQRAAAVIQAAWRAYRQRLLLLLQSRQAAATLLQSAARRWLSKRRQLQAACRVAVAAATTIQATWRRCRQQRRYQEQQAAAAVLQRRWRCRQAQQELLQLRQAKAAVTLQVGFSDVHGAALFLCTHVKLQVLG